MLYASFSCPQNNVPVNPQCTRPPGLRPPRDNGSDGSKAHSVEIDGSIKIPHGTIVLPPEDQQEHVLPPGVGEFYLQRPNVG